MLNNRGFPEVIIRKAYHQAKPLKPSLSYASKTMILKCICYTIILLFHYSYSNDNLPNWHNNSGIIQESKSLILTASLRTNSKIRLSLNRQSRSFQSNAL
ncbi:hypothetical protein GJ496_002211 [Pomphorhynchus laevis]|nr:hypothetical protein GJ496_002211 [Pomphorhynchus laevis]